MSKKTDHTMESIQTGIIFTNTSNFSHYIFQCFSLTVCTYQHMPPKPGIAYKLNRFERGILQILECYLSQLVCNLYQWCKCHHFEFYNWGSTVYTVFLLNLRISYIFFFKLIVPGRHNKRTNYCIKSILCLVKHITALENNT